jgi:hypothetical protein
MPLFHPLRSLAARLCLMLAALALPLEPVAMAQQPPSEEARARFKRGTDLFAEHDYRAALIEFERAYQLAPNWKVLFNIGQVQYLLQDYAGALVSFERYLREGGPNVPSDRRQTVRADVEKLKTRVAYVEVAVNEPGAEVLVDDVIKGTTPLAEPLVVSAGRRKLTVSKQGFAPATRIVDVAGGDAHKLSVELALIAPVPGGATNPSPPTPLPPPPDEPGAEVPWAGWIATGVFATAAIVLGALAINAKNQFSDTEGRLTSAEELQSKRAELLGFSIATDVMIGVTAISAGVSLYFTIVAVTGDNDAPSSRGVPPALGLRVGAGQVAIEGRMR